MCKDAWVPEINVQAFAIDLKFAREEKTLQDLTDSQWHRVCNRIANALHHQGLLSSQTWDHFMEACGCPKGREAPEVTQTTQTKYEVYASRHDIVEHLYTSFKAATDAEAKERFAEIKYRSNLAWDYLRLVAVDVERKTRNVASSSPEERKK